MTPECPKGPEREARPELRERIEVAIEDACTGQDDVNGGTVYFLDGPRMPAELADVLMSVVAPELERLTFERDAAQAAADLLTQQLEDLRDDVLGDESLLVPEIVGAAGRTVERLTAEVERLRMSEENTRAALRVTDEGLVQFRALSVRQQRDCLRELLRGMARRSSQHRRMAFDLVKYLDQKDAEVSRLREQLAAQQAVLTEAREVLERVGCQFDMCTGPTIAPVDMRTCYVCEFLGRTWSTAGAPKVSSAASSLVHNVVLSSEEGAFGHWHVTCSCRESSEGDLAHAEFWKDQHLADTLVPTAFKDYDLTDVRPGNRFFIEKDEGRPSGSERLAPRPVETFDCEQDCPAVAPECWCVGVEPHRLCCHENAAKAARSGASPSSSSDVTLRRWTVGDPEPSDDVTVRSGLCDWRRGDTLLWHAYRNDKRIGQHAYTWSALAATFDLTEVPSPSLRREGEDTPMPAVSSQEETKEGETDGR